MAKKINIGDEVRLTEAGIEKKRKKFPGYNPSATTGFVTRAGFKKPEVIVAISDGESYSISPDDLEVIKTAPKSYRHPNAPNIKSVEDFTIELHGSGIDYDWEIEETNTSFRASNAYHTMDEHGGYDSVVPFTVIFPKKASMEDFKLQFAGDSHSQHQVQKYMLREYLEDTIALTISYLE